MQTTWTSSLIKVSEPCYQVSSGLVAGGSGQGQDFEALFAQYLSSQVHHAREAGRHDYTTATALALLHELYQPVKFGGWNGQRNEKSR